MQSGQPPIGFEGIFCEQTQSHIGFEQYEGETKKTMTSIYPADDTMPRPNQSLQNNIPHSNYPSFIRKTMPSSSNSSEHNISSHRSSKKSLSFPQLFAIYTEIVTDWYQEKWLKFIDNHHEETYLTLDSNKNEYLTIQMAINQYDLTSGTNSLHSPPECLLIRTKSKSKTLFFPNSIISIVNLCDQNNTRYKLMAILCHSNETNNKIMFYHDTQSNNWYIYFDQSISSNSHSNQLSHEQQYQLESFIKQENQINDINLTKFTSPLSALHNHPIVYVYIPAEN